MLKKFPFLGKWIDVIGGVFIARGNAKEALKSIQEGIRTVTRGYNLTIFPEGTRSHSAEMGEFKSGSFKLAAKSKAPIVPVTVSGTYHLFEEKKLLRPAHVTVMIHPVVRTAGLGRAELKEQEAGVEKAVREGARLLALEDVANMEK